MNLSLWLFRSCSLLGLLFLLGCSTLQPIDLPDETGLATADSEDWATLKGRSGESSAFTLLNTGEESLEWRLRGLRTAVSSVDLQTFLWLGDRTGMRVLKEILATADRGVKVRILLDDTFTIHEDVALFDLDRHPHVEVRLYNPFQARYDSFLMRELLSLGEFSRVDHRMHNKVMIFDNRAGIVGGRNLADEYFGHHEAHNFRDLDVLAIGEVVLRLTDEFDAYWNSGWAFPVAEVVEVPPAGLGLDDLREFLEQPNLHAPTESSAERRHAWRTLAEEAFEGRVELLADKPAEKNPADEDELPVQLAHELVRHLEEAKEELILVSAYLIPTPELEAAIERAVQRGVRVRILTNSLRSNNHTAADSAYRHHVRRLLDHGADLHEVRALARDRDLYMRLPIEEKELGLHAKFILLDHDKSFIGSANLDPRSLRLNTEIGLLIHSPELNARLREFIAVDFHSRNAWQLVTTESGAIQWVADDAVLHTQPAASRFQRLEDWFFRLLPIEGKM